MAALWTFLEGLASFVSPCVLPLLPVYAAYFAARPGERARVTLMRALAFVIGFTVVFVSLGVFAGSLGAALATYRRQVSVVCGLMVVVFGLAVAGVVRLPLKGLKSARRSGSLVGAFGFGLAFAAGLTPCVGAFLGAALMQAASAGGAAKGAALLLAYSAGLGVPLIVSALLLSRLGSAFGFVRRHYRLYNWVCALALVGGGLWMAIGPFVRTALPAAVPADAVAATGVAADGEVIEVTEANFIETVVRSPLPVLVDFWSPDCGPCLKLSPLVASLARARRGQVRVCKVNVEVAQLLASDYHIRAVPVLMVFSGWKVLGMSVGYLDAADLDAFVDGAIRRN